MSWIVETLLINRHDIRSNLQEQTVIGNKNAVNMNFESDDYMNLLQIERTAIEMFNQGLLTELEIRIIDAISIEKTLTSLEKEFDLKRYTISKKFSDACQKIAYRLGGEFTDEGYIEYMKNKYRLEDYQVELIKDHIISKYKHRIRRITNG